MARKAKDVLTKTCTKTGKVFRGTFDELRENFYRDSSQRDGLSPWCKDAERAYNKAYRAGLKGAKVERKGDIAAKDTKGAKVFEDAMRPERVTRRRKDAKVVAKRDNTRTRQAKATTKARKSARKVKANA